MKLLLVLALLSTHCQQNSGQFQKRSCKSPNDIGNIRLVPLPSVGAIQICFASQNFGIFWSYVNSELSETAAQVSCRQLGFLNARVTQTSLMVEDYHRTITNSATCDGNENRLHECWGLYIHTTNRVGPVAGLICDCSEGEIRLVAGSTNREDRIELCSNGGWGTVCGDGWTEREAALVCSRLGYSSANATVRYFGGGTESVYNVACQMLETDPNDCNFIITPSSCHHSMDVGVKCLPFTDACAVPVNDMTTNNKQPPISTETSPPTDGATTESSISQSTAMSTSGTLGALIGLLAAALVVVVTGWIVSCVYFQRKINKKYEDHTHTMSASMRDPTLQLNNPAYGVSTTVPHTTYSSHGPSYEVTDTNEGAENSYDVISHRGAARPHPHITPSVSNEEYSTLDTSRENHYHTLECNTGDGQYSMVGQADPQNDRPDPQNYEVPAPLQGEEYSTLKH